MDLLSLRNNCCFWGVWWLYCEILLLKLINNVQWMQLLILIILFASYHLGENYFLCSRCLYWCEHIWMNIASTATLRITRVNTSARACVYQMFARFDQKSDFLIKVWSAGRPLISAGNQIKAREILRNVTGEIEYSDNGNRLRSTALETRPSALPSLCAASSLAAWVISSWRVTSRSPAHRCPPL